jgi:hypothetical protein
MVPGRDILVLVVPDDVLAQLVLLFFYFFLNKSGDCPEILLYISLCQPHNGLFYVYFYP